MNRNVVLRTMAGMVAGVLALGAVAVGVTYAQQPMQPRGHMAMRARGMMPWGPLAAIRRGLAQLGLSDEQSQQVRSVLQARQAELRALHQKMRQARRAVADAIASEQGEADIRARSAELAKVQADLAVFHASLRTQLLGVLTPEQQAKLKEQRLRALERADRFIQGRKKMQES